MYYDDPFSPVNTLDENFYKSLKKSFFQNKKNLTIQSKTFKEIINLSKVENKIDFNKFHFENLKTVVDNKVVPGYELFATIAFDAKKVDDMSYYPIVKK